MAADKTARNKGRSGQGEPMRQRIVWISVAVLATLLIATGASIAFVVTLPARGVEEAVRKKLRSEHALVRDVRRVENGWCGEYIDPEGQDGVPDFQPFHAAKSADGRWTVTTRAEVVRKKCG
jgi:hypothetical protein